MVKQRELRQKLETPEPYDRDDEGNVVYTRSPEGTAGRAFTYNEHRQGELPPDEIPNPQADSDIPNAATAALIAAALATRQKEMAVHHDTEAMKHAGTPVAGWNQNEARIHRNAQAGFEQQERSLINDPGSPPPQPAYRPLVYPNTVTQPQAMASARPNISAPAPRAARPVMPHPPGTPRTVLTPQRAAMDRAESMRDHVELISDMPQEIAYENATNLPFYAQEIAGGIPAEAPNENGIVASGPLPAGSGEGFHNAHEATPFAGERAHEMLTSEAHHAHLEARGVAELARQRGQKANARAQERRSKGLDASADERAAGWATQQELRARGVEALNLRVEDGQRVREREDIGAEKQMKGMAHGKQAQDDRIEAGTERRESQAEGVAVDQRLRDDVKERIHEANRAQSGPAPLETDSEDAPADNAGAIAAAEQGAVQPVSVPQGLPANVQVNKTEFGTSYVFVASAEGRDAGFEPSVMLGVDDGRGNAGAIAEKAWTLAGQMEAMIKAHADKITRDNPTVPTPEEAQGQGPYLPPDVAMILETMPADRNQQAIDLQRNLDETVNRRVDVISHKNNHIETDDGNDVHAGGADSHGAMASFPDLGEQSSGTGGVTAVAAQEVRDEERKRLERETTATVQDDGEGLDAPGPDAPAPK